ncbi:MAG TPA: PilZ domain-containing protein [Gammaproteobacteria bacterium]|nr:PilZ domain-containing protein [Gammaproteobacteria bacterium]
MSIDYEEKRDFIRMHAEHALQFREVGSEQIMQGICCNLSATGIMFTTDQPIPQGAELEVNIKPEYSVVSPFDAVVKVLRTQANGEASRYLVAGKITSLQ